jgi:hypothetical protein
MNSTLARPARRFALTLVTAGIAVLGSVAVAPAASAAPAHDGLSSIVEGPGKGNGPDAFIVTDHGRVPVFFCDDSGKHAKKCTPTGDGESGRF